MNQIIFLIENIAPAFYIFGGIVIFFGLIGAVRTGRQLATAEYALERELAMRQRAGSITRMLFAVEVILGMYAIANVIAPTVRYDLAGGLIVRPGAEADVPFATQPPGARSEVRAFETLTALPRDSSNPIIASATPIATAPGTVIPGAPAPIGCEALPNKPAEALIMEPLNGQVLYEKVEVKGVANVAGFARYKFEISGPSTGNNFAPFGGDKTQPVKEPGLLGQLSLLQFEAGQYQLRLAVFDSSDQLKASCAVTVYLRRHPPTPTPVTPTPTEPKK